MAKKCSGVGFSSTCSKLFAKSFIHSKSSSEYVSSCKSLSNQFHYYQTRPITSNVKLHHCVMSQNMSRNRIKSSRTSRCFSRLMSSSDSTGSEVSLLPKARRAFMYVPGDSEKMVLKASQLLIDSICLDMEDGVADSSKDKARDNIAHSLDKIKFKESIDVCVRINPVSSTRAVKDLEAVFGSQNAPESICVPKVEDPAEVDWLLNKIYGLAMERPPSYTVHIVLICETPRAIINLQSICNEMNELSTMLNCNLVPDAIVFGSDDYLASVGATRTEDATEVLYVRQKLLMVAKMFSLQAIDMVYNDLANEQGLIKSCTEGKLMGFNGKQIINPKQIETVQTCFSPTEREIKWATGLVAEWEKMSSDGVGAILYEGKMIDMPLVKQARNILRVKQNMNL